jgi:hypothetical protein
MRTERLGIRVEPEVRKMLDELAAATGLSISDVIRQAVRREHGERFPRRRRSIVPMKTLYGTNRELT